MIYNLNTITSANSSNVHLPNEKTTITDLLGNKKPNPDPWNTVPVNGNLRKKEEKITRKEKEKETTKANVPIAQNTQFY